MEVCQHPHPMNVSSLCLKCFMFVDQFAEVLLNKLKTVK